MDKISRPDRTLTAKTPSAWKPLNDSREAPATRLAGDALAAKGLSERINSAQQSPVPLSATEREQVAAKKATCPFIGTAIATAALPVRNSQDRPLASIDEVRALGNTGGGDLGEVLEFFASGNHTKMLGPSGSLDLPVPKGLFSLDFPGSQGSHPGHSGILQGDPKVLNSGRLSQPDLDRLLSRAKDGYLKRSDIAAFMAENLRRDPDAKVLGLKAIGLVLGDAGGAAGALFQQVTGSSDERRVYEALTKALGEDNLVGTAGEFGLLMAFLAHSPKTMEVDGEPAVAVEEVTAMFRDHRFPEGWETWPKTKHDWLVNTTALLLAAGKDYLHPPH